jgi:hypothetical protein
MGHSRLGWLPRTHRWQDVVALVAGGASAAAVADATLDAAERGLDQMKRDSGVKHVLWLMTHVVMAARDDAGDFAMNLAGVGLPIKSAPSTFELVGAFTEAVDKFLSGAAGDHAARHVERTDFSEMAQMAAAESFAVMIGTRTASLFEGARPDVREAVRELSTPNGFGSLAHDFFTRFTGRFLNYHLSRELSRHVGAGTRFVDARAHERFLHQLERTCSEAALIVRDYAGGWYSKAKFEQGVVPRQVATFLHVAVRKLRNELERRGDRHVA